MLTKDFSYNLPEGLIAQNPVDERGNSRMLVLERGLGIADTSFQKLPEYLKSGDLVVLNDTFVIPARLFLEKESGGKVELVLERIIDRKELMVQLRANKTPKSGTILILDNKKIFLVKKKIEGLFLLNYLGEGEIINLFNEFGHVPLPPYIKRIDNSVDKERYQTVFSDKPGAVAAPTAGLHFTKDMLNKLSENGINNVKLTLHIGTGTFQPVREEYVSEHKMHSEYMSIDKDVINKIIETKNNGGRILAVGTTVVRSLESAVRNDVLTAFEGETDIFIYPGYKFNVVDMLLTNFHLPESTLLMLVCAFAGKENVIEAYHHAISKQYKFYSYGDAMLLINEK
jgi:S-adenosylmethionine:tRNA ribosyltransferase-isomerase|tara:strand:- start:7552 stop:8577 length:1026 start_codon:yes stop_codon:yes gene_type:complete